MPITVVSWNINRGQHLDQIIEELSRLQPNIIGFQEVIETQEKNIGQVIADKLGYSHMFCEAYKATDRNPSYAIGNSLLTKHAIVRSSCHPLSTIKEHNLKSETEPRTALEAEINIQGTAFTVVITHLGYSPKLLVTDTQKMQLSNLLALLKADHFMLMGDFNALPDSELVQTLEKQLRNTDEKKDTPTRTALVKDKTEKYRVDYILTSRDLSTTKFTISETSASDHSLLAAVIEI